MEITANLIERLLALTIEDKKGSLGIEYNPHERFYETIEFYDDHMDMDWLNPEEKAKAIENNTLWVLRVYPHTPIGFWDRAASSLSAIIDSLCFTDTKA